MTNKIKPPNPGLWPDVDFETYRAWDAMNASTLDALANTTPKHFRWLLDHPEPQTPAMRFGILLHALTLEPFDFAARYAVAPDVDKRTKAGKEAWGAFAVGAEGKVPVSAADYERARAMSHAIQNDDTAGRLLQGGRNELSLVAVEPQTGILCKGRMDCLKGQTIADIKTTISAKGNVFEKAIYNYGYHRRAAFYHDLMEVLTGEHCEFFFIAVEKEPPHDVVVYPAGESIFTQGRKSYLEALRTYRQCLTTGVWPGYPDRVAELPEWAIDNYEVEIGT